MDVRRYVLFEIPKKKKGWGGGAFLRGRFSRINSSGFTMYLKTTILEEEMGRKD
jgi:hypothetical protein